MNVKPIALFCSILAICSVVRGQATQGSSSDSNSKSPNQRFTIGGQATLLGQYLPAFHSPYSGTNSLASIPQARLSDTYTLYLGAWVASGLEFYLNPEMARGGGIGDALGLAGYTNGDVIRNPTLGQDPYL